MWFVSAIFGLVGKNEDDLTVLLSTNFFGFLYGVVVHGCVFGNYTEIGIAKFLMKYSIPIALVGLPIYYYGAKTPPMENAFEKIMRSIALGVAIPVIGYIFGMVIAFHLIVDSFKK